ncbi:hypothetical protein BJV74DRAFT_882160 [Russula compacta]|nr:hypothetical protein BJV74DRAFT_882160 [Russula compacta]
MSSSDSPQIRLSLPQSASSFKRSFDQYGFDLESPLDSAAVASSSGTDEHRPGPSNGDRNKRARSNSVTPNSAEQAHSTDSSPSSSSSHTMSSASSNHAAANHSNAPPAAAAARHPQTPENDPVFPYSLGEQLSHTSFPLFDPRPLEASPGDHRLLRSGPIPCPLRVPSDFHYSRPSFTTSSSRSSHPHIATISSLSRVLHQSYSSLAVSSPTSSYSHIATLPLSSPIEHSDPHISPTTLSRPSVESLSYISTSTQASASAPVPPPTVPPSTTSPDRYHSDMSPLRFEEFGEFREVMGLLQGQNPTPPA